MYAIWIIWPPQLLLHAVSSFVSELLCESALLVLKDEGFSIPLEPTRRARFMAERYLGQCMRGES